MSKSAAFSIAEALITLMIISLILAAVIPVMSRRQSTTDSMWRYVSGGLPGANSDIYYGLGTSQTAIFGGDSAPLAAYKSRAIFITPVDVGNDTIKRSLLDFYQVNTLPVYSMANIGKISFDQKNNTAVGKATMTAASTTGDSNTAIGANALKINTTGLANTAIGNSALVVNTTGNYNTAVGGNALFSNIIGSYNTATGISALQANTADNNTASGFHSMMLNTTGAGNTASGRDSLFANISGNYNTAYGFSALSANATGDENTSIGKNTMIQNTSGSYNTAVGAGSLKISTTGTFNSGSGYQALYSNLSGSWNTATGAGALLSSSTGSFNTAFGGNSLQSTSSGGWNTGLGLEACRSITTGSANICIGNQSGPTTDASGQLFIDVSNRNDPLIWGDFNARTAKINGTFYVTGNSYTNGVTLVTSDKRLKNIYGDNNTGIEKLNKLQIKTFFYKKDKVKRPRVGVIAQDLQKVFPNSVVKAADGCLYTDNSEMFYAMLNSIRDMYKQVQSLIAKVFGLDERIKLLEKDNLALKKRLDKLEHKK